MTFTVCRNIKPPTLVLFIFDLFVNFPVRAPVLIRSGERESETFKECVVKPQKAHEASEPNQLQVQYIIQYSSFIIIIIKNLIFFLQMFM